MYILKYNEKYAMLALICYILGNPTNKRLNFPNGLSINRLSNYLFPQSAAAG